MRSFDASRVFGRFIAGATGDGRMPKRTLFRHMQLLLADMAHDILRAADKSAQDICRRRCRTAATARDAEDRPQRARPLGRRFYAIATATEGAPPISIWPIFKRASITLHSTAYNRPGAAS